MSSHATLILKILRVELEEIEGDVLTLEKLYGERFAKEEITNYVWQENRALLLKELSCVKALVKDLEAWTPPTTDDDGDLLRDIKFFLYGVIDSRRYPGLVRVVIDRKIEKVGKYIQ